MRKSVPFILTIVVSVLCTATLVHAAGSSGETALEPSSVAPSDLLGSGLDREQVQQLAQERHRVDAVRQVHDRQHVQG